MAEKKIPPLHRNRPTYSIENASLLWAFVFGDLPTLTPTPDERKRFHPELRAAHQAFKDAGIVQTKRVTVQAAGVITGGWWHGTERPERTRTENWIDGPDLAALFAEHGRPGAIGFSDSDSDCSGAEGAWPYSHDTRLLQAVRWVIETYSKNVQWPTRDLVIDKLQERFKGMSKNEASAVDTVTRPDAIRGR